jgi:hypothetical protein
MIGRAVVGVGFAGSGHGQPPPEEFLSIEAWLLALPDDVVMRIQLEDGTSYLTSAERLCDSSRLGEVVERIRIQQRLRDLERPQ